MNGLMPDRKQTPLRLIKKILQWQLGDTGDLGSGLWSMPPRESQWWRESPLGGRLSSLGSFPHLIIHARLGASHLWKKARLHCFSNSRHFDCLLAVSLDNPWPQKQIPCAIVPLSGEDEERKRERAREKEREREASSLSRDRGELNICPCQTLSVSLGDRVWCATSKTADKQALDLFNFLIKAALSQGPSVLQFNHSPPHEFYTNSTAFP